MKVDEAESKLNNLVAQNKIALCHQKDIDNFISYIDVVWGYDSIPEKDGYGIRGYKVVDRGDFE